MSSETRGQSVIDYQRKERSRRDNRTAEEKISDAIKRCSRALEAGEIGDFCYVAERLGDDIIPLLSRVTDKDLLSYGSRVGEKKNWQGDALGSYIRQEDSIRWRFRAALKADRPAEMPPKIGKAKSIVQDALSSATCIAEHEDILLEEYSARVDVHGFATKLGVWLQDEELDVGDPVYGVTWQSGGVTTLIGGRPGQSKSTALESEVEDFWLYAPDSADLDMEFEPTKPFSVVDLVDFEKGENWFPDIPQQQEILRKIREDHGVPSDFTGRDEPFDRRVEIYAPLTPSLEEMELPHDVTGDDPEPVVTPFVIPASDIPKALLMKCIQERVSNDQMRSIRKAYDDVDRERNDWGFTHLADEIRSRDELSDKHKADAIGTLRALQDEGFIRTGSHEHTLDWEHIFTDTDTYTLFTQAQRICESDLGQVMCVAYLLDKMLRLRGGGGMFGLPELVVAVREFWDVVPHKRRENSDERVAAVQEFIGTQMERALRRNRHYKMNFVCDTQAPYDLKNSVREMFNRYVIFTGTNKLVDGVFSWTQNDKSYAFADTLTAERGQAGVVGDIQPAIDNDWMEFISPMNYIPPSHHHYDKEVDRSGWHARCKYLTPIDECPECGHDGLERSDDGSLVTCSECGEETVDLSLGRDEELRSMDVDGSVPEHLEIEAYSKDDGGDEDDDEAEEVDPSTIHRHEARNRRRRGESYREIRENIRNNPDTGNPYSLDTIRRWVEDIEKGCDRTDD